MSDKAINILFNILKLIIAPLIATAFTCAVFMCFNDNIDKSENIDKSAYETITIEKSPIQIIDHIDESDEMIIIYLKAKEDYNEGL